VKNGDHTRGLWTCALKSWWQFAGASASLTARQVPLDETFHREVLWHRSGDDARHSIGSTRQTTPAFSHQLQAEQCCIASLHYFLYLTANKVVVKMV